MPHLLEPFPLTHSPTSAVQWREWGDKRPRCITGQSQGDFRTVASPMASTPHWGGHLSPSAPLPLPSLFPLFHPTPAPNILGPTVTIQPGVDQCKTHNIKAAYFWKCVCVTVRAFHGWRINLASLLGSPPIFCRSTRFCSEMTNGGFSLFGFYSRGRGSSRWLSAKSDQFGKWAAAPVNSHLNPGPSIAGAVTLIFSHVTTVIVKQLLKRSWNNTWESRHIQFSSEVLQVQWRSSEVSDCRTH